MKRLIDKLKSKRGFAKEQLSDVVLVLIVVTIIMIVIFPIFNKQKQIVDGIRRNELEIQQKFSIND